VGPGVHRAAAAARIPGALQSFGRYLAFGLIALPLAWLDRARLALLTRADWVEALKLAAVGNIVYYLFLASAIQRAGGPLPTMIIGTLPVVIAIASRAGGGARSVRRRSATSRTPARSTSAGTG
jgi:drug/metabolite transporter (DMT)-like permease